MDCPFLSVQKTNILLQALIISPLEYCNLFLSSLLNNHITLSSPYKMQLLRSPSLFIIQTASPHLHVNTSSDSPSFTTSSFSRSFTTLLLPYWSVLVSYTSTPHLLCFIKNLSFIHYIASFSHKLLCGFFCTAIHVWNTLSKLTCRLTTLSSFKSLLQVKTCLCHDAYKKSKNS